MTDTTTSTATPTKPSISPKQQVSINNIVAGLLAKHGDGAPNLETIIEGSNVFLVADNWPTIKLGRDGGIDVPDLRSFADPLEAAINASELVAKQKANDLKKAQAKTAAPAQTAQAPATPAFETGAEAPAETVNA